MPDLTLALATSAELPRLDPDSNLLLPAFAAIGVEATPCVWTDERVDWAAYDALIVRSPWDYFDRPAEFAAWVDRASAQQPRFLNPPDVVRWNAHKSYLGELGERGVPVVDTVYVAEGETVTVPFDAAVAKPAVAGGSQGLRQLRGGDTLTAETELLVQPLLNSIRTEGELSLLYAGGELSHAVRKTPAAGDIRSQPEFGSQVVPEPAPDEARKVARTVLDAVGHELAYARVDLVRAADGTLRLIELEVIEPQLYLAWDETSPARFATAIADAARSA
ncbi:MAG TPA: hypothetical protein VN238_05200 [Solirubrobacteraceae bacterium]|nr:hypothetical protein [Solirubrobacteraceae bacterium]